MVYQKREYARGTFLYQSAPWGFYRGGAALCPDGKVRRIKRISETADTFFSVPASVAVRGKTVAGYVTTGTASGLSTPTDADPLIVFFIPYANRRNGGAFAPADALGLLQPKGD